MCNKVHFSDEELAVIYRSVKFESMDFHEVDQNGVLGDTARDIQDKIENHNKKLTNYHYVNDNLSQAPDWPY